MNDEQWLTSTDPEAMLEYLAGRVTERKLRLFACACVRRHWVTLGDERSRQAVEVAERYADGLADEIERFDAWDEANCVPGKDALVTAAVYAVESDVEYLEGDVVRMGIARDVVRELASRGRDHAAERAAQSALLRCIFGPRPFGTPPRTPDSHRLWEHRTVSHLARTIYDEYAFDLLGVLADALEEAGCTDAVILDHLRDGGPHARGCFALDSCLLP